MENNLLNEMHVCDEEGSGQHVAIKRSGDGDKVHMMAEIYKLKKDAILIIIEVVAYMW